MRLSASEKIMFGLSALLIAIPVATALLWQDDGSPAPYIPPYPAPPNPNGYDVYVAAAHAFVPANPPVDSTLEKVELSDKDRAKRYSLARKTAWLKRNKKALALFDQAQTMTTLAPPDRSKTKVVLTQSLMRSVARDKLVESNARWMRGDADGALRSGLQVVRMGHDVRRGGGVLTNLISMNISARGRRAMNDVADRVSAKTAKTATRELEGLVANRWSLVQSLTEDKYLVLNSWDELAKKTPIWRVLLPHFADKPTWKEHLGAQTMSKARLMNDSEKFFDQHIAQAELSYAKAKLKTIVAGNTYMQDDEFIASRERFNHARDLAGDQVLMLRLALRAFYLENGAYPPNLNALAPAYIKAVPVDPFGGGEPMRYKIAGNNYLLYSIGPDGKDDGGKPAPWPKAAPKVRAGERAKWPWLVEESKGDYVAGRNQ